MTSFVLPKDMVKSTLHPRNRNNKKYDFPALIEACPELKKYISINKHGKESIDFFNPVAVKLLNATILKVDYGIDNWDIPDGYLCPPIPGRTDYIHCLADLLGFPNQESERILDVGVGANCIYPIVGVVEYGWKFVGSEIDPKAIKNAKAIVQANKVLTSNISIVLQAEPNAIFKGILDQRFDATMCNPPFHSSAEEANRANIRKLRKLKQSTEKGASLNFGGQSNELWCKGGELAFIKKMIDESVLFQQNVGWFTCLISKGGNQEVINHYLNKRNPSQIKWIEMHQGNKRSRILAWKY